MGTLTIGLAQINPTVGDFRGNVSKIVKFIERARAAGADLAVFPELAVCGYPPEDLLVRPRFLRDSRLALQEVARQCRGIDAVVGFADGEKGRVYNGAAVIADGRIGGIYRKAELPNYGVFDEKRYFTAGRECPVFTVRGISYAVTICEDVWVEGSAAERCASGRGVPLVINISASPFHAGKLAERVEVLARFAGRTGTTVCYTNLVGGQDELVFDGGSLIVNAGGEVLADAARFEEDLMIAGIDLETRRLAGPARKAGELGRLEEIYRALVLGTRDYVNKNGFEKAVIGLSGGIDSALTAVVAVDALGSDRVVGVTMPSRFSSAGTRSDAALLAGNLAIPFHTIPIEGIFGTYLEELKGPLGSEDLGVAGENIQARIRGNILMALSNRFGWLVLTTGNKSETAVGYCTLYGDMAGGFAVIKDVPKTLVYELSEYVNRTAGQELIPAGIIRRPPTAELRENQKDEDSLPPYEALDPILKAYVEEDLAPDEIAALGYDLDLVESVVRMVDLSEYKRRQAPPGVKITPKAFGRDRRLPITNRYLAGRMPEGPEETL